MSRPALPPHDSQIKVRANGERGALTTLGHGVFFGRFQSEIAVGGFALARVGADPHRDVQRHTHDTAHFIFVTRGLYATTAAGAPEVCRSPILIYNPPGTTHRDRFARREDGHFEGAFVSISIDAGHMERILEAVSLPQKPTVVKAPRAGAVVARLTGELEAWDHASPLAVEGLCLELTACTARSPSPADRTPPRWLSTARDLLSDGGLRGSVGEIASACGVHPVHLARAFREYFRCSPGAYSRRRRVERAAALLRRPALTLAEVAQLSGFADQSHMTHAFRRVLGVTPATYRRAGSARAFDSINGVACAQDVSGD